jgi:hypothetical protein
LIWTDFLIDPAGTGGNTARSLDESGLHFLKLIPQLIFLSYFLPWIFWSCCGLPDVGAAWAKRCNSPALLGPSLLQLATRRCENL